MLSRAGGDEAEFEKYRRETALRVAEYTRRAESLGPALEEQNLDELAELLGERPADGGQGDAALEEYVHSAGPERDGALLRVLHRRLKRHEWLVDPVMRELRGAKMQRID
jgi:hypothetical protein